MSLTILADDLTGACDSGALFAGKAPVPVTIWPRPAAEASVRVVDTESRGLTPGEAASRVAAAVRSAAPLAEAGAPSWFKKIDSTMRGPIGAEIEALLVEAGLAGALACPAFPVLGRTVLDRTLYVDGVPVTETPIGLAPGFPGSSPSVVELLRPHIGRPVAWIPIAEVRTAPGALAARLGRLAGTVALADAETDDDLDALVGAALAATPAPLLVGSAGMAQALAGRLGLLAGPVPLPRALRPLVVAGSRHPATRRQVAAARDAGLTVLATPDEERPDPATTAALLAREAARRIAADDVDLVIVTGGETAVALAGALGAVRIDLLGAPRPGLALGLLVGASGPPLPVVTKAGGFGGNDLLVALLREAAA